MVRLSSNPFLREKLKIRTKRSPAYQKMTDVEYVLRYFVIRESWRDFSGDFRTAMDIFMDRMTNPTQAKLDGLEHAFVRSLTACKQIWGHTAFRRPEKNTWRDQTLAGMFDAQMVSTDLLSEGQLAGLRRQGRHDRVNCGFLSRLRERVQWVRLRGWPGGRGRGRRSGMRVRRCAVWMGWAGRGR